MVEVSHTVRCLGTHMLGLINYEFSGSTAYSLAKFGMSLITLGLSGELRDGGIGANCKSKHATSSIDVIKTLCVKACGR